MCHGCCVLMWALQVGSENEHAASSLPREWCVGHMLGDQVGAWGPHAPVLHGADVRALCECTHGHVCGLHDMSVADLGGKALSDGGLAQRATGLINC